MHFTCSNTPSLGSFINLHTKTCARIYSIPCIDQVEVSFQAKEKCPGILFKGTQLITLFALPLRLLGILHLTHSGESHVVTCYKVITFQGHQIYGGKAKKPFYPSLQPGNQQQLTINLIKKTNGLLSYFSIKVLRN